MDQTRAFQSYPKLYELPGQFTRVNCPAEPEIRKWMFNTLLRLVHMYQLDHVPIPIIWVASYIAIAT